MRNPLKPVEDDDGGPIEDHQAAQVKMKALFSIIYLFNFICSFWINCIDELWLFHIKKIQVPIKNYFTEYSFICSLDLFEKGIYSPSIFAGLI